MYNMYIYSYLSMTMCLSSACLSIILNFLSIDIMMEWLIYSNNSMMLELFILIDWISMLFISFVLLISSMIILYSIIYMNSDKYIKQFMYMMILFISSMLMMILSPSLMSILFGWDMLGLISYCLVIYYQNLNSFNSGMVTVLSNRVGDVGLLLCIGLLIMNGSWNIYLLKNNYSMLFMIFLAAITKSAQVPFSSWLPMAMSAPTPVSALVHSSTLVTAGVYLIIRFNKFIMDSNINSMLMLLSILTMIMSGTMAIYEFDLKKIIALSTLSQLGIMMMTLSLGLKMLSFYHLLTHAIFKSLLFMCAGMIIHSTNNNQDIRYYGQLKETMPFISTSFSISTLSLMSMPFMSGFYSKDLIIEMLYIMNTNLIYLIMIIMSMILTVIYSLRLFYYMFYNQINYKSNYMIKENKLMNISMMILIIFSMSMGSILNWLFFFDMHLIFLNKFMKIFTLTFTISGIAIWITMLMIKWTNLKFMKLLSTFNSSMWMLNLSYSLLNKYVLSMSENFTLIDSIWNENIESKIWLKTKLMIMNTYYFKFKLYKIIFSYMVITLIMMTMMM